MLASEFSALQQFAAADRTWLRLFWRELARKRDNLCLLGPIALSYFGQAILAQQC